jgi:hypothetical protein
VTITCNGCTRTWTGLSPCHCAGCHITFNSLRPFDIHRRSGECRSPADSGLVLSESGYWVERIATTAEISELRRASEGLDTGGA